jgi:hypothetical protein
MPFPSPVVRTYGIHYGRKAIGLEALDKTTLYLSYESRAFKDQRRIQLN